MYTTTNYGFNIVEGTDMVNPLTQLNPNFTSLDTDLKAVSDATVDAATCIKTGTVHAVTRTNTDAKVFKFTATGNWNTGDTMTVDGTLVSVYLSDGTAPSNNCYVINTEVLAAIQGTRVTLYVNSGDASNISFDDTSVSYTANNVQTALEEASTADGTEYSSGVSVKNKIDNLTKCDGLLSQLDIPTAATSYACDWFSYYFILVEAVFYDNCVESMLIPTNWFGTTSIGQNVRIRDAISSITYTIYANGSANIYAQSSNQVASNGIRIKGFMKK